MASFLLPIIKTKERFLKRNLNITDTCKSNRNENGVTILISWDQNKIKFEHKTNFLGLHFC